MRSSASSARAEQIEVALPGRPASERALQGGSRVESEPGEAVALGRIKREPQGDEVLAAVGAEPGGDPTRGGPGLRPRARRRRDRGRRARTRGPRAARRRAARGRTRPQAGAARRSSSRRRRARPSRRAAAARPLRRARPARSSPPVSQATASQPASTAARMPDCSSQERTRPSLRSTSLRRGASSASDGSALTNTVLCCRYSHRPGPAVNAGRRAAKGVSFGPCEYLFGTAERPSAMPATACRASIGRWPLLDALAESGPEGLTLTELSRAARRLEEHRLRDPAHDAQPWLRRRQRHAACSGATVSAWRSRGSATSSSPSTACARWRCRRCARSPRRPGSPRASPSSTRSTRSRSAASMPARASSASPPTSGRREHLHSSAVGKAMLVAACPRHEVLEIVAATGLPPKTPHTIVEPAALLARPRDRAPARLRDRRRGGQRGRLLRRLRRASTMPALCLGAISVTGLKLDLPAWRSSSSARRCAAHALRVSAELGAPLERRRRGGGDEQAGARRQRARLARPRRAARARPGPGEVVVGAAYCGLCGSDLELLRGEVDAAFVRYPLTLGHEWSGTVEAVGAGVAGLVPGPALRRRGHRPLRALRELSARARRTSARPTTRSASRARAPPATGARPARIVHRLADARLAARRGARRAGGRRAHGPREGPAPPRVDACS